MTKVSTREEQREHGMIKFTNIVCKNQCEGNQRFFKNVEKNLYLLKTMYKFKL